MFEWVCKCGRAVTSASETCPFCGGSPEAAAAPTRGARAPKKSAWGDVERGLRVGLGMVLVVVVAYFVVYLVAYFWGHEELVDRLIKWLPLR